MPGAIAMTDRVEEFQAAPWIRPPLREHRHKNVLERLDLMANCALSDAEFLGSPREASVPRDRGHADSPLEEALPSSTLFTENELTGRPSRWLPPGGGRLFRLPPATIAGKLQS